MELRWRYGVPAVLGAAAATVVVPDLLRLDARLPMIATVAWRPQAAVATAVTAALLAPWRAARPTAVALGAVAAVGMATTGARVVRGPAAAGGTLTILSVNVLSGRADTGDLAALIEREAPDLVVLPEAGCDFRDKLAPLVAGLGYRGWAATPPGVADIAGVVLLAGPRAGELRVRTENDLHYRHLRAAGGILGERKLLAIHTTAPRTRRLAARWRSDLGHVGRWTRMDPPAIVVGDLNATLDNAPLRRALGGCVSVASGRAALTGTFPAALPRWFGIQIDHVLAPAGTAVERFSVHDVAGTDHRGVLARIRLPD